MLILDTSALRALSGDKLKALTKRHRVGISPITFYELMCHLDDTNNDTTFDRQRGQVIKCALVEMLPDPYAYHAHSDKAIFRTMNPSRFEEMRLVPQMIELLKSSATLAEFYGKTLKFEDGAVGPLRAAAEKIRAELDADEKEYVNHVSKLRDIIAETHSHSQINSLGSAELHSIISSALNASVNIEEQDGNKLNDTLRTVLICGLYAHFGYKVWRTVVAMRKELQGGQFSADPNDLEDGYIALYLRLFEDDVLVTEDKGTIIAFNETLAAVRAHVQPGTDLGISVVRPGDVICLTT